jgi:hypothetical protein
MKEGAAAANGEERFRERLYRTKKETAADRKHE